MAQALPSFLRPQSLPQSTWNPTPGLTQRQWQNDTAALGATGARGYNGQLWGTLQPGDTGYDPQKAADYSAMRKYGVDQGWVQPHKASWSNAPSSIWKSVGPVALGALGGMALSGTGAFAGAAGAGSGAGAAGGGSSAFGGMGTGTMSTVGGGAASTGAAAGGAGWAGAGGSVLPSGFGVGGGIGLGSTTGGSLGFMGPAASGGSVAGSGLGLSAGGATAGAGTAASGGLNGFLSGIFGSGAGKLGTAGTLGVLGQIGSDFYMANRREDAAREAAGLADPFASQRPQYQQQLQQHMTDPSSFMNSPQVEQAVEAAARKMAAMGYNLSPNQADEIRRAAMDQYYRQTDVLSNLSGAGFGPGNAGSVSLGGMEGANAQRYQGLADIGTLVGDIYSRYRGSNPTSSQYSLV